MIAKTALQRFRGTFRGALLRPLEEGYDEARRVWNGAIDRKPALIARCAGSDDVVAAVRFAREHDLTVSVRCGGHSIAGYGVCDDGLMIEIAGTLGISARTVEFHKYQMMETLGTDNSAELIHFAIKHGLVSI